MTKKYRTIKIPRSENQIPKTAKEPKLKSDTVSKHVDLSKDNIKAVSAHKQKMLSRRKFIADNDTLKGTDRYLGIRKLAKKFAVCTSTIWYDRKVIAAKGIVGKATPPALIPKK